VNLDLPVYRDREAFSERAIDRDLSAIGFDLIVADRKRVAQIAGGVREELQTKSKG